MEGWRKIEGLAGRYEVSSLGRVRRIETGLIMRQRMTPNGYFGIVFSFNRERKTTSVHRLVAGAFLGPCPNGKEVDHIDGDKTNNGIENLRYLTKKENMEYAKERLGRLGQGYDEENHQTKLSNAVVVEIRRLSIEGFIQARLAEMYGVNQSQISRIVRGKRRSKRLRV